MIYHFGMALAAVKAHRAASLDNSGCRYDELFAKMIAELLRGKGYEVWTARNGLDGRKLLSTSS